MPVVPFRGLGGALVGGMLLGLLSAGAAAQTLQPPLGGPLNSLTPEQLDRWTQGRVAFDRVLLASEGLGPTFNQNRCSACHSNPGSGGSGSIFVTRFGVDEKGSFDPLEELGGSLLQSEAIDDSCKEFVPPEANVVTTRITTLSLGLGLLEAIADSDIAYYEEFPPAAGISGRVHWVLPLEATNPNDLRAGRFGWKSQVATVLTFSADAALNEMGLTSDLLPEENAPNGNQALLEICDTVPDPEDQPDSEGFTFVQRVTDFQRLSAGPPQTPRSGMTGEALFVQVGCTHCHVASFTTINDPKLEEPLRDKVIKPYSDFLLHNMGQLADGIVQGDAQANEFRTPPLWGIRWRDPMLHDGRVAGGTFKDRILGVVAWHAALGSESRPSGLAFQALSGSEQDQIVAFLDSLGKREFDANGDNVITPSDLHAFRACYGGSFDADSPCAVHDVDQDGTLTSADFELFLTVYTGWKGDCDKNGIPDPWDILTGALIDADQDGYPDSCCPGDLTNDNQVDQADLAALLAVYNTNDPSGDLDGDYDTDQADLALLLSLYNTSCP